MLPSLVPSHPNIFRLQRFLPASEKKLGWLGTRLDTTYIITQDEAITGLDCGLYCSVSLYEI